MTSYFAYDELTWPDVADLPRDMPLVIPLGSGYPLDRLADALGRPEIAGLLPAYPFGWRGSGLEVPDTLLEACLANLVDGLRDDGFSQVFVLMPQGLEWGTGTGKHLIGAHRLALPQSTTLPRSYPSAAEIDKVILIPIGHTEQHGFHLPLSVDTICIDAISHGTATADPESCWSLPVMPYGVSTHRPSFAGTMNIGGRAFEDFWIAVIDTLVSRGFRKFYFLSGHGGNVSFLVNVIKYSGERHREALTVTSSLYLNGPDGIESLEKHRLSNIGGMGHACELETSFLLYLRPELCHMERVVDEINFISTPSYLMDWIESGALIANPPWDDDTVTGAYGAGSVATAEHGKIWLEAAIAEKVKHVEEIHSQLRMRQERRAAGYGLWGKR